MPQRMFVVLTRGRTGSTVICADINQHPDVVCHEELFRSTPVSSVLDLAPSYEAVKKSGRTLSTADYLTEVLSGSTAQMVGFKALLGDLDRHEAIGLEQYILENTKTIFLTREPVRMALSAAIASCRGAFNLHKDFSGQDYLAKLASRVQIDPEFVINEVNYNVYWSEIWQKRLRDTGTPHININYEEYVNGRQILLNRVFDFLGVGVMSTLGPTVYLKVTSENVWEDIINADEIHDALVMAFPDRMAQFQF
jgi:LPS sulfotransferase NodH